MIRKAAPRLLQSEPMRRCELGCCQAACCLHGVWVGVLEMQNLLENAELIKPFMPCDLQDPQGWFDDGLENDEFVPGNQVRHSRVLPDLRHYGGTACIFLRSDYKCALQVAGASAGFHPWHFKPFYCILHPLDLDEQGNITLDETHLLLDEPASCLRPSNKSTPLIETFEEELRYLLGHSEYEALKNKMSQP